MHTNHTPNEGASSASQAPAAEGDEPQVDPVAEARRLVAEDEAARMQACAAEIQEVLARYGMSLEVTPPRIVLTPNA